MQCARVQWICKIISTKSSKIAIHENLDPRKLILALHGILSCMNNSLPLLFALQAKSVEIEEQNKVIAVEKADAEAALAEALPALEEARIALSDLDKNDVTEIR